MQLRRQRWRCRNGKVSAQTRSKARLRFRVWVDCCTLRAACAAQENCGDDHRRKLCRASPESQSGGRGLTALSTFFVWLRSANRKRDARRGAPLARSFIPSGASPSRCFVDVSRRTRALAQADKLPRRCPGGGFLRAANSCATPAASTRMLDPQLLAKLLPHLDWRRAVTAWPSPQLQRAVDRLWLISEDRGVDALRHARGRAAWRTPCTQIQLARRGPKRF